MVLIMPAHDDSDSSSHHPSPASQPSISSPATPIPMSLMSTQVPSQGLVVINPVGVGVGVGALRLGPKRRKDKAKHSESETRRRTRLRQKFNLLREASHCTRKDRYTILNTAIAQLQEYETRLAELENAHHHLIQQVHTIHQTKNPNHHELQTQQQTQAQAPASQQSLSHLKTEVQPSTSTSETLMTGDDKQFGRPSSSRATSRTTSPTHSPVESPRSPTSPSSPESDAGREIGARHHHVIPVSHVAVQPPPQAQQPPPPQQQQQPTRAQPSPIPIPNTIPLPPPPHAPLPDPYAQYVIPPPVDPQHVPHPSHVTTSLPNTPSQQQQQRSILTTPTSKPPSPTPFSITMTTMPAPTPSATLVTPHIPEPESSHSGLSLTSLASYPMLGRIAAAFMALDGRFVDANSSFCELMGCSRSSLLASSIFAVSHPSELIHTLEMMKQLLSGETETYECDKQCVDTEGHVINVHLTVSGVQQHGKCIMFVCLFVPKQDTQAQSSDAKQSSRVTSQRRESHDIMTPVPFPTNNNAEVPTLRRSTRKRDRSLAQMDDIYEVIDAVRPKTSQDHNSSISTPSPALRVSISSPQHTGIQSVPVSFTSSFPRSFDLSSSIDSSYDVGFSLLPSTSSHSMLSLSSPSLSCHGDVSSSTYTSQADFPMAN